MRQLFCPQDLERLRQALWVALFAWMLAGYGYAGWLASSQQSSTQHPSDKQSSGKSTNSDKQKSWVQRAAGDPIAVFTFFLVLVTGTQVGLFYVQLRLIRRSLDEAKSATEAATEAAKAAISQATIAKETFNKLERPYLHVSGVRRFNIDPAKTGGLEPFVRYNVANYGKIAAIIDEVYIQNCSDKQTFPTNALLTDLTDELMTNRVIGPGNERANLRNSACLMDWVFPDSGGAIPKLERDEEFFFYIEIRYHGPFTDGHVTKACWRWHDGEGVFVEYPDKQYNCVE